MEMFRRAWPDILEELKSTKRFLWMTVAPNASVTGFDGRTLTVSFAHPGALTAFTARPEHISILGQSIQKVLGVQVELAIVAGGSAPAGGSGPKVDRRPEPAVTSSPAESAPQQHTATPSPVHPHPLHRDGEPRSQQRRQQHLRLSSQPHPVLPRLRLRRNRPNRRLLPPPLRRPCKDPRRRHQSHQCLLRRYLCLLLRHPVRQHPRRRPRPHPSRLRRPSAMTTRASVAEPTYDSEPWDDAGGDSDASSVPVPDWDAALGTATGSAEPAWGTDSAAPAPRAAAASLPPVPPPATPKGYVAPAPSLGAADRPVAPPPGASAATWGMPVPAPAAPAPSAGAAPVSNAPAADGKLSRYQRLMNRAAGVTDGGSARVVARAGSTDPTAGAWGNPADAPDFARPRPTPEPSQQAPAQPTPVESDDTEFVPSDDDIAIEDSSLLGVPAIERILKGRVIEERDPQGNVIERPDRIR